MRETYPLAVNEDAQPKIRSLLTEFARRDGSFISRKRHRIQSKAQSDSVLPKKKNPPRHYKARGGFQRDVLAGLRRFSNFYRVAMIIQSSVYFHTTDEHLSVGASDGKKPLDRIGIATSTGKTAIRGDAMLLQSKSFESARTLPAHQTALRNARVSVFLTRVACHACGKIDSNESKTRLAANWSIETDNMLMPL